MMRQRASDSGISLLEVLVVLAIIALVTGGLIFTMPARSRPLDVEAAKLEQTMRSLADRAVITGRLHTLAMSQNTYQIEVLEDGDWVGVEDARVELPRNIRMRPSSDIPVTEDRGWRLQFDPVGVGMSGAIILNGPSGSVEVPVSLVEATSGGRR